MVAIEVRKKYLRYYRSYQVIYGLRSLCVWLKPWLLEVIFLMIIEANSRVIGNDRYWVPQFLMVTRLQIHDYRLHRLNNPPYKHPSLRSFSLHISEISTVNSTREDEKTKNFDRVLRYALP